MTIMSPSHQIGVLRVLDAEANRAAEAARVVEDYLRFVLDDRHLTEICKHLRHQIHAAVATIPADQRLDARETRRDVGTSLTTQAEQDRTDANQVLAANMNRLQQSLRSLEEYGKVLSPAVAARFEALRYTVYTLERATAITLGSRQQLPEPALYVLVDGGPSEEKFAAAVTSLIDAGVSILQLRDKTLDDRRLVERAQLMRRLTRGSDTLFIMNDRPDIATLAAADGVHVGQEELSVKDARSIVGPGRLIGVSTHNLPQARQAVLDGANYIGVGPTFESQTKRFDQIAGITLLHDVRNEITLPAFAIGGITEANLKSVTATGFRRVAVASAVWGASDPAAAARRFGSMLAEAVSVS
jgi:thiamine-phosphate pyrophosphorylase